MSFVMLTESQVKSLSDTNGNPKPVKKEPPQSLLALNRDDDLQQAHSLRVEANARLFEILSARSDIDHPICTECTELLLSSYQAKLQAATKERDAYITFLKELKNNILSAAEVSKAEQDLSTAKAAEEEAFAELLQLEKEKAELEEEMADLDAESRALDLEEEAFWRSRNAFDIKLAAFRDHRDALNASFEHDSQHLERLRRTNVYNDAFCIGHDGHFGTINGLRLGKLSPPNNVEWAEINAAWGTTVLLLATVAEKLGFSFKGYVLKPMGSTSHIERIEYPQPASAAGSTTSGRSAPVIQAPRQPKVTSLELFSSGDLPLGRQIIHRRFNEAMVAFLECLAQLGDFVDKTGSRSRQGEGLKLPYPIEKDRIHGVSIKLGVSQDEAWTSACKYTLTCCKYLLAHASNVATGGKG